MLGGHLPAGVRRVIHGRIVILHWEVRPRGSWGTARGLWTKGVSVGVLWEVFQFLGPPALGTVAIRVQKPRHYGKLQQMTRGCGTKASRRHWVAVHEGVYVVLLEEIPRTF